MRRFFLCLLLILFLLGSLGFDRSDETLTLRKNASYSVKLQKQKPLSSMAALDLIKEKYALNFEKVEIENTKDYYYKLPEAEYYLVYEDTIKNGKVYLIHLYEFVTDDEDEKLGHTVTYGWYQVNKATGKIKETTY